MYSITPAPPMPKRPDGFRLHILIVCGLLSALVAGVAAGALAGITSVRNSTHQAVAVDGQLSRLASAVANQTLESRRYEKDFFLNIADLRVRAGYLAKWQASAQALDQAIVAFGVAAPAREDQQQAARWREQAAQYRGDFGQIAQAVADGRISTSAAANEAFTPFKENIRVLTESSAEVADRKAALEAQIGTTLEATGARTIWLVGMLAALALMVAVGYGAADAVPFRRDCVDCRARLPIGLWVGGEHRCGSCALRQLARQIEEAEILRQSKGED